MTAPLPEDAPLHARLRGGGVPPLPEIPRRLRFERADGATRLEVAALRRPWWAQGTLFMLGLLGAALPAVAVASLGVGLVEASLGGAGVALGVGAGGVGWQWSLRLGQVSFWVLVDGAGIRYAQATPQGRGPTPLEGFWPHHVIADVVARRAWGLWRLSIVAKGQHIPLAVGLTRAEADAARALIARAVAQT